MLRSDLVIAIGLGNLSALNVSNYFLELLSRKVAPEFPRCK
jgi:hypothetical protein